VGGRQRREGATDQQVGSDSSKQWLDRVKPGGTARRETQMAVREIGDELSHSQGFASRQVVCDDLISRAASTGRAAARSSNIGREGFGHRVPPRAVLDSAIDGPGRTPGAV
jgi:hypothetical protein